MNNTTQENNLPQAIVFNILLFPQQKLLYFKKQIPTLTNISYKNFFCKNNSQFINS